jgi:uncharacterized protein YehS (DUF1456 family)
MAIHPDRAANEKELRAIAHYWMNCAYMFRKEKMAMVAIMKARGIKVTVEELVLFMNKADKNGEKQDHSRRTD